MPGRAVALLAAAMVAVVSGCSGEATQRSGEGSTEAPRERRTTSVPSATESARPPRSRPPSRGDPRAASLVRHHPGDRPAGLPGRALPRDRLLGRLLGGGLGGRACRTTLARCLCRALAGSLGGLARAAGDHRDHGRGEEGDPLVLAPFHRTQRVGAPSGWVWAGAGRAAPPRRGRWRACEAQVGRGQRARGPGSGGPARRVRCAAPCGRARRRRSGAGRARRRGGARLARVGSKSRGRGWRGSRLAPVRRTTTTSPRPTRRRRSTSSRAKRGNAICTGHR